MMIINENIAIKIVPSNINYWKNKKYDNVVLGNTITVKVFDIPKKSSYAIQCKCDECERTYEQRIYRNLDVCGYCLTRKRMLNNTLGKNKKKHECSDVPTLIQLSKEYGKQHIASHFNVTITVVNRWLKEHNIIMKRYKGLITLKTDEEEQEVVNKIRDMISKDKHLSDIVNELALTRQVIKNLMKKHGIQSVSKFDKWKQQFDYIVSNIDVFVDENRTKTLNEIANDHKLSIEQLKKAFKHCDILPKIHSYNKSKGEIECRDFIRSLNLHCDSYRFEKLYEIDCFVNDKKFGIEYCGEYWHKYDPIQNNRNYHKNKREFFSKKGITLMTIFENEWKNKNDIIKSMIRTRLGKVEKIYARKCSVSKIDRIAAENFHIKNHISGKTSSSLNYGLLYDNELISVLSIIKSRFDKKYQYEISRFCSSQNIVVTGGLSKLFSYFIADVNPDSCVTYADLRFGEGKSYEKIGFKLESDTTPNYFYYNSRIGIMENRMNYQKAKLKNLPEYEAKKSEFQIMTDAGYYILFDCGNKKYGWRKSPSI